MTTMIQTPPPILPTTSGPRRRRTSRMVVARRKEAAALVIPSLIPILLFSVVPLLSGVYLAFTSATLSRNSSNAFTGFGQFRNLIEDQLFLESFKIGLIWAFSVTLLQLVAGLGLALLLNADLRLQNVTRLLALIPWAMPPVVVAIMWKMLYNPNSGPINGVIRIFNEGFAVNWLGNFATALPAAIVVGVWVGMPQTSITLLAGLQQIPAELVEAAEVDGASTWQTFVNVTLPAPAAGDHLDHLAQLHLELQRLRPGLRADRGWPGRQDDAADAVRLQRGVQVPRHRATPPRWAT